MRKTHFFMNPHGWFCGVSVLRYCSVSSFACWVVVHVRCPHFMSIRNSIGLWSFVSASIETFHIPVHDHPGYSSHWCLSLTWLVSWTLLLILTCGMAANPFRVPVLQISECENANDWIAKVKHQKDQSATSCPVGDISGFQVRTDSMGRRNSNDVRILRDRLQRLTAGFQAHSYRTFSGIMICTCMFVNPGFGRRYVFHVLCHR